MAQRGKGPKSHGLGFDLSKPIKQGQLLKQGALHKAFKSRFFVLYPGFLVYYEDTQKWRLDVTRGDTLQSRQGAIKLKNGTCQIARSAPKGCKFGLVVHAPDPQNKRPTYLLNATSKEERDMWIEAIKQGTPHSPKAARKNEPKADPKKKEEPVVDRPKYTQRQETCDVAAVVASEAESNHPEESITSIDKELHEGEPTLNVRRDTTNTAALALTTEDKNTNIDSVLEETEPVTSIDDVLGPADDDNQSEADILDKDDLKDLLDEEESTEQTGDKESENKVESGKKESENTDSNQKESEEVAESSEMESKSEVSEMTNGKGDTEVVTSVSVVCNSEASEVGGNERGEDESPAEDTKVENGEESSNTETVASPGASAQDETDRSAWTDDKPAVESLSTEIIIPAAEERHTNSFTINSANPGSETDSDTDEDGDGSSISSPPPPVETTPTEVLSNGAASGENSPTAVEAPVITLDEGSVRVNGVTENGELKQNGNENGEVKQNGTENGLSAPAEEGPKLSPVLAMKNEQRRPSAAFIQKVGYLYKLGGHRKNWKLRYFVLNPGVFFYYKNPKSTKPLGEVKLKNTRVYFPASGERKTSYQFCVHTESQWNKRMEWVIAAQSEREMKEWIEAFKAAGHKSSPSPSPSGSPTGSDHES